MNTLSRRIQELSLETWGSGRELVIEGDHPGLTAVLEKLERFARYEFPLLITGESGVGKELFARGFYLLSSRRGQSFLSVNCPQYQDGNLTVSELFGHLKGSFTGAVKDHQGIFESANGGMVFLDEIGDLHPQAQVILLRFLAEKEFTPVGSNQTRKADVRVVAATNLDLLEQVAAGKFRLDLYYRLRYFRLRIPALRERGDDWKELACHYLAQLNDEHGVQKRFSKESFETLQRYHWPGNIRELKSIVTLGFSASQGDVIQPNDILDDLESHSHNGSPQEDMAEYFRRMLEEGECFWKVVYDPFMNRELNRRQVKSIVRMGLKESRNSYRGVLKVFRIPEEQYLKFMDFLRHHDLKP